MVGLVWFGIGGCVCECCLARISHSMLRVLATVSGRFSHLVSRCPSTWVKVKRIGFKLVCKTSISLKMGYLSRIISRGCCSGLVPLIRSMTPKLSQYMVARALGWYMIGYWVAYCWRTCRLWCTPYTSASPEYMLVGSAGTRPLPLHSSCCDHMAHVHAPWSWWLTVVSLTIMICLPSWRAPRSVTMGAYHLIWSHRVWSQVVGGSVMRWYMVRAGWGGCRFCLRGRDEW